MALWRWYFLSISLLTTVLLVQSTKPVFRTPVQANTVFQRPKRANSGFIIPFEEMLKGNLERECYEERCTYEEAREYFEDTPNTIAFWTVYVDGDQCKPNPCLHDGYCTDGIGRYSCNCTDLFHGLNCEIGAEGEEVTVHFDQEDDGEMSSPAVAGLELDWSSTPDMSQCPTSGPSACQHFCEIHRGTYRCFCVTGYKLHSDERSCIPAGKHPCGVVSIQKAGGENQTKAVNHICPDGRCPWQVLLVDQTGEKQCGGVILGRHSVLTSAQCVFMSKKLYITGDPQATGMKFSVQQMYIHSRYKYGRPGDNLALLRLNAPIPFGPSFSKLCLPTKDFSENVLMSNRRDGVTGGANEDPLRPLRLSYISLEDCRSKLNLSHPLSNKMFCMENPETQNGQQLAYKRPESQNGGQDFKRLKSQHSHQGFNGTAEEFIMEDGNNTACKLPSGTPMATVEGDTVFLTGVLLSPMSHDCRRGVVFTKLSRYLPWINKQLELSEAEMTPQLNVYPEEEMMEQLNVYPPD